MRLLLRNTYCFSNVPKWATVDPWEVSPSKPYTIENLLDGKWSKSSKTEPVIDPLNGGDFLFNSLPASQAELDAYVASQRKVPNFGLHNPIRNVNRYMKFGEIFMKIAEEMRKPEVEEYFVKLTQRVMPKSTQQVRG